MNQSAGEVMEEVQNKSQNENDYYLNQWATEFGDEYSKRCDVDPEKRVDIYEKIFDNFKWDKPERKILELGANRGHNLVAIETVLNLECRLFCQQTERSKMMIEYEQRGFWLGTPIIRGVEPNRSAIALSDRPESISVGNLYDIPYIDNAFDVVFTSGVLIHIPRKGLEKAIQEMARVSSKYVMMIEYESKEEEGRHYREFDKDGVWSRDFGKELETVLPDWKLVKKVPVKELGDDGWGFTDCTVWIYEKP